MSDFKTIFTDLVSGTRYSITDSGIEQDRSLTTAVIISLFTDKRDPAALPDDARGWWGDDIGSLRWTLSREKQTNDVLNPLIKYDTDALQWLQDAGLVTAIEITASWVARGVLHENIVLTLPDGSQARYLVEEL